LLRSNQVLADAVAVQLMRNEETQTPTATSSVMFGPSRAKHAPHCSAWPKNCRKAAVRFSPFASMPTKEEAEDTDLEQVNRG